MALILEVPVDKRGDVPSIAYNERRAGEWQLAQSSEAPERIVAGWCGWSVNADDRSAPGSIRHRYPQFEGLKLKGQSACAGIAGF